VIYELEVLSLAHAGDPGLGSGRLGRGLDGTGPPPNVAN
jgi:hypothetical protein